MDDDSLRNYNMIISGSMHICHDYTMTMLGKFSGKRKLLEHNAFFWGNTVSSGNLSIIR